jgi:hypothetical protein
VRQPDVSRTPAGRQPDASRTPAGRQPDASRTPAGRQPDARYPLNNGTAHEYHKNSCTKKSPRVRKRARNTLTGLTGAAQFFALFDPPFEQAERLCACAVDIIAKYLVCVCLIICGSLPYSHVGQNRELYQ